MRKVLNELGIVLAHEDECTTFVLDQLINLAIVIALVCSTEDKYGRCGHAL